MTAEMAFECLLCSYDPTVYTTVGKVLRDFGMSIDLCLSAREACYTVARTTHELVIIDWEETTSAAIVDTIWKLERRKKPIILLITGQLTSISPAHLILPKPISCESLAVAVRNAYSRMLMDYRMTARFAVMTALTAVTEEKRPVLIKVTDIGAAGLGLYSKERFVIGDTLFFSLPLPGATKAINIQARIIWTRDYGSAGCEFLGLSLIDREILDTWLKMKTQVKKPLIPV